MSTENTPDINENHISIGIFGFKVHPHEISKQLELSPSLNGIKGENYFIGPPANRIEKTFKENFWTFRWKITTNEYIGDIIEKFIIEIIKPRIEALANLSETSSIQFQIVQYYYTGCNPGIAINKECMKILQKIGACLDIDIYCLGE